jgi:drug/metabolite transporter (DMT)-like permease
MANVAGALERGKRTSAYARGAFFGLAAVSIWAANIVVAGLGLKASLTPWDISAIRFGVAGLLLVPILWRRGLAFDRLGWVGLAALVFGGAPAVLLANAGLLFAPAAHAGALFPGVMPLMVAILAAAILDEPFTRQKRAGFALIVAGVVAIVWGAGGTLGTTQTLGHLLFLGSAFAWACYTIALRRSRLDGLHAAAISAVGSMIFYWPPYALLVGTSMFDSPLGAIALQALVQGLLTAVVSYLLYGMAVAILGASSGAAFAALCPAMTALMAIPLLGEWPSLLDCIAITLISTGVYVVSTGEVRVIRATDQGPRRNAAGMG